MSLLSAVAKSQFKSYDEKFKLSETAKDLDSKYKVSSTAAGAVAVAKGTGEAALGAVKGGSEVAVGAVADASKNVANKAAQEPTVASGLAAIRAGYEALTLKAAEVASKLCSIYVQ